MASLFSLNKNQWFQHKKTTFIIAEIGQNHQGSVEIAKQLITEAKLNGADCVKFQKTNLEEKFNKAALSRPYNNEHSWGNTYGEHKRYLEFSEAQFQQLQNYAREIDILFTASAMDHKSLEFLYSINVPFIKIGSGDANNFLLIKKAASLRKPLIISTGMQNFETVQQMYETVSEFHKNFCLMHCVSSYPTPVEQINLNVIKMYQSKFPDILIGYSGHEMGIDISVNAVAMGAKVIERHLTLDKTQKGSDHSCSLLPSEFGEMVKKVRNLELAFGTDLKTMQHSELSCYKKLGKTIVMAVDRSKGHTLCKEDLKVKVAEPKGIDGSLLYQTVGKQLRIDVAADESLLRAHLFD